MRLHVVSLPHTQVTADFPSCAFTQKVRRFCRMMSDRGHEVLLYAGERTDAPCTELITCISENKRRKMVGDRHYTEADWSHPYWNGFNARVIEALEERLQPRDFICLIGGWSHKPIADAFPNHVSVEFGIGYAGTFARFRVFESYAWMHMVYGAEAGNPGAKDGQWFDAVIPNQIDDTEIGEALSDRSKRYDKIYWAEGKHDGPVGPDMWPPSDYIDVATGFALSGPPNTVEDEITRLASVTKHNRRVREWRKAHPLEPPYALYVGRLIDRKGFRIAQDVCQAKGVELILAGPGSERGSGYGRFVGEVDAATRATLMAGARCLFAPTQYVEPFGTVTIEAMACGTPVICTDWGAFTETIQHGVHGFRCRTFAEFCAALDRVSELDPWRIRADALRRFSMATVAQQYEDYFNRLATVFDKGWYQEAV